tara:strand:+ start:348 stop:1706 length:1359 start_codon:yes stop_codon:yes gene_type:complete
MLKKRFFQLIFLISCLIFLYTLYKSEFYWEGSKRSYYELYYIISIFSAIISIFIFYLNHKIQTYFFIFFISSIFSIYSFEIYLISQKNISNLSNQQNLLDQKILIFEKENNLKFDTRNKIDVFQDLLKENPDTKVNVGAKYYFDQAEVNKFFPLSGVSSSKTLHCNENGYYSIYQSDRYGFNNPDKDWDEKNIEFFLVGDSFVHGNCVNRPNDIASVLRNLTNGSVLNLGYDGDRGPLIQYASIREYLNPKVKNIIWFFFENDFVNLENELKSNLLKRYISDQSFTQNLKLRQKEVDNLANKIIETEFSNYVTTNVKKNDNLNIINLIKLNEIRKYFYVYLPKKYLVQYDYFNEFETILRSTKEISKINNSNLFFVYLPRYSSVKNNIYHKDYINIKNIVDQLNIPLINTQELVFNAHPNPLELFPFKMGGHYNEKGYKKIAEVIYEIVENN